MSKSAILKPKTLSGITKELSESVIEPCKEEGVHVLSHVEAMLEGDFAVERNGTVNIEVEAGTNVPTDPVEADAKVGWLRKLKRQGVQKVYIHYRIVASTDPLPPDALYPPRQGNSYE